MHNVNECQSIFQDRPFPLGIYDRSNLKCIEVDKAAEDHYGYTRSEFLNMSILDNRSLLDLGNDRHQLREIKKFIN